MNIFLTLLLIIFILLLILSYFLATELLKKFRFMKSFIEHSNENIEWEYNGDKTPAMYNIVLESDIEFCALITFELNISILHYEGVDYYGYLHSKKIGNKHRVIVSTYLGSGSTKFQFLINNHTDKNPVKIMLEDKYQSLKPDAIFRPHWYQKLGFYG